MSNQIEHLNIIKRMKIMKMKKKLKIKVNCEIRINVKKISFSYFHKFNKKGKKILFYIFLK